MYKQRMVDRPKRIIQKPVRYQTTSSSDNSPPNQLNAHIQVDENTMISTLSRDMNEFKECLNNRLPNMSNVNCNTQSATHSHLQSQTLSQTQYSMENFRNDMTLQSQSNANLFPQAANRLYGETPNTTYPISVMSQLHSSYQINHQTSNFNDGKNSYFSMSDERYRQYTMENSTNYR